MTVPKRGVVALTLEVVLHPCIRAATWNVFFRSKSSLCRIAHADFEFVIALPQPSQMLILQVFAATPSLADHFRMYIFNIP